MAVTGLYYHLEVKNADKDASDNAAPQFVHVRIYDLALKGDDTVNYNVVEITGGSGDPFHLATVDNSEDKFTPLKPIQATIKFLSSSQVDLSTFTSTDIPSGGVDPGDPRWYVEAYYNTYDPLNIIFKGFINLDDCSKPFLPDPNEVILVANDGLAGLKNIPLTDFNKSNATGYNRVSDYLAWALTKTGLDLNIKAVYNIREATTGTNHFFDSVYLHAKTFEDDIGTCMNCYDVLSHILGETAFLTQRNGEWWIVRIDEIANLNPYYVATFDSKGVFVSIDEVGSTYDKSVARDLDMFLSQEATTVHPQRPYKFIKESYRFDYPKEIIDNIDFSRGDLYTGLPMPNMTVDGITYYQQKYHVADWTLVRPFSGGTLGVAYIRKLFVDINHTYEKERYLVIDANSASPTQNWLQANIIPISVKDKFDFSVDIRMENDKGGSGDYWMFSALLKLVGDDGSIWLCGTNGVNPTDEDKWVNFPNNIPFAPGTGVWLYQQKTDLQTEWTTISCSSPPAPITGTLYIYLTVADDLTNPRYFNNLQFSYIPFINGGYSKYSSYSYKISRDINLVNKRDNQVYISDAPKKLFKGALFKVNGWKTFLTTQASIDVTVFGPNLRIIISASNGDIRSLFPIHKKFQLIGTANNDGFYTVASTNYSTGNTVIETVETLIADIGIPAVTFKEPVFALTNTFFRWNDIHLAVPNNQDVYPFGRIQAYDVWNQYRNGYNKFQATIQGLDNSKIDANSFVDPPHLIHRYLLQDSNESTDNRFFMLLSFDMDFYSCEWKGTLVEVYNTQKGKNYQDILEIKYEQ